MSHGFFAGRGIKGLSWQEKKALAAWAAMKGRCEDPNHDAYHNYGGRGISVCLEWSRSMISFFNCVGFPIMRDLSLDRIDNNGNYEPGNVRWATRAEQGANKRNNTHVEINGVTKHISEWARIVGCTRTTICDRLERGWSGEKLLKPPRDMGQHRKKCAA